MATQSFLSRNSRGTPCARRGRRLPRGSLVAAVLAATALFPALVAAQALPDPRLTHWAYAATFGSGVYDLGEGTEVLVARFPFSWAWRKPDPTQGRNLGVRFLFPVTLGVQNFNLDDVLAGAYPTQLKLASFLPGVEFELPRTERWTLRARAQTGWGSEIGGTHESAVIYAVGIRSRFVWPDRKLRPAWISGVERGGYKPKDGERQSMSRLTNGVELDIPIPRWEFHGDTMHLMPHVMNDWYYNPVRFFSPADNTFEGVRSEWEIGVAAGRERPFSIFGLKFDRVGIAFRHSEESRGIRFLFGSIF